MGRTIVSERILKIGVGELKTIRIKCKGCKAISEIQIDNLTSHFPECKCAHCPAVLIQGSVGTKAFESLQAALKELRESSRMEVEFVVSAEE
jgi:phage FluMu protein Com